MDAPSKVQRKKRGERRKQAREHSYSHFLHENAKGGGQLMALCGVVSKRKLSTSLGRAGCVLPSDRQPAFTRSKLVDAKLVRNSIFLALSPSSHAKWKEKIRVFYVF